jgi:hypothetical protein
MTSAGTKYAWLDAPDEIEGKPQGGAHLARFIQMASEVALKAAIG